MIPWHCDGLNIKQSRLAIAVILLPILYLLLRVLPPFFFFLFLSVLILRVQYEFYRFFYREDAKGAVFVGLALGFLLSIGFYQEAALPGNAVFPLNMVFSPLLMAIFVYFLFSFSDIKTALVDSAVLFLGVAYISGLLSYLILLRHLSDGRSLVLFLLLVVWGGDAVAYYVGRSFGKRKLYPKVSPNKTIEGAIGGLAGSFLGGGLAKLTAIALFSWTDILVLSLLLGGFGQLGDLTESLLKRSAGVKDSSGLIPAHGGLFDKLDSIAFAAPVFYYYLFLVKGFGRLTVLV
ncbi:MAG: phosphatidate cytidylyltransferase [Nitrospiria bacterium]